MAQTGCLGTQSAALKHQRELNSTDHSHWLYTFLIHQLNPTESMDFHVNTVFMCFHGYEYQKIIIIIL